MPDSARDPQSDLPIRDWSNRILIAASAGILFLTLYPFQFSSHAHGLEASSSPFLLGGGFKRTGPLNFLLNVLLFAPFGFGLASKLDRRNWARPVVLLAAWLAGSAFSYAIEFTQLYVPLRDSGWEDVVWNGIGSFAGALVFAVIGNRAIRFLSSCERTTESRLSIRWAWVFLFAYFVGWTAVSVRLQKQTSLESWEPSSSLFVGNNGSLRAPWKGKISRLQIWDSAIPARAARDLASYRMNAPDLAPLADYDFSLASSVADQRHSLPDLVWVSRAAQTKSLAHPAFDGSSWMISQRDVSGWIATVRKTNQFAVRVVCRPASEAAWEEAIASVAHPPGREYLSIWQENANLYFLIRNPATTNRWRSWHLTWSIPEVFAANQERDILISYDGSNLQLFIDGKRNRHSTQLGPGVALANLLHRAKPGELSIYNYIYYAAVFLPLSGLLGIAARKLPLRHLSALLLSGALVCPLALQLVLSRVSGASFSYSNFALSATLAVAAALWINTDRHSGGSF